MFALRRLFPALIVFALISGCASDQKLIDKNTSDKATFEGYYAQLLDFQKRPGVMIMNDMRSYVACDAYKNIVLGGAKYLPFVIEKIENGDFILNLAMTDITGIDVWVVYKNDYSSMDIKETSGEQFISKLWVRWWKEQGPTYMEYHP